MAVVVGYAATDEGRAALARAAEEAALRGTGLVVVGTGREPVEPAEVAALLAPTGVAHEVSPGGGLDAADDVIAAARDADLVVIGLRRRTPVGKLIIGANATRILLEATCPVLTVKPA